MKICIKSKK